MTTRPVRQREAGEEGIPETRYERTIRRMLEERQANLTGEIVSKGTSWGQNRQGYVRNFSVGLVPTQWTVFQEHVIKHSGKHRHQGGFGLYVLAGEGYSIIEGERYDWKKGDLLLLPIARGGVEHQHFETGPDGENHWIAFWYEPFRRAVGDVMEQIEENPFYDASE